MGKPKRKKIPYRKRNSSPAIPKSHTKTAPAQSPQQQLTPQQYPSEIPPPKHLQQSPLQQIPLQTIPSSWNFLLSNSLLSFTPPRLFSRSRSMNKLSSGPEHPQNPKAQHRATSVLENKKDSQEFLGVAFCSAETEELPADFQLCTALKSLLYFKSVKNKNISIPYLFWGARIVTTFVRSPRSPTKVCGNSWRRPVGRT